MTLDPSRSEIHVFPLGCCDPDLGARIIVDLRAAALDPVLIAHREQCLACEVRVREFLEFDPSWAGYFPRRPSEY